MQSDLCIRISGQARLGYFRRFFFAFFPHVFCALFRWKSTIKGKILLYSAQDLFFAPRVHPVDFASIRESLWFSPKNMWDSNIRTFIFKKGDVHVPLQS